MTESEFLQIPRHPVLSQVCSSEAAERMKCLPVFQLHILANFFEAVPKDVALCERSARIGLEKKSRGPAANGCFQQHRERCRNVNLPDSIVRFRSLNCAPPNALSDSDRAKVAGKMLAKLQPEGLTNAKSGPSKKGEEHPVAPLGSCQNLFDFRCGQGWLALFLFINDRKADEVEVPVPRIELLALLDRTDATTALTTWK